MKRSQIILFSVFIVLSALIYTPVIMNKKDYEKTVKSESKTKFVPVEVVKNETHLMTLNSYGQVSPVTELLVSFEVQGKLIQGDKRLKPGVSFRKGELLYKVDSKEYVTSIMSRKTALTGLIAQSMPDFALDFPQQKQKWEEFMLSITAAGLLPELPGTSSEKERLFWTTRNVLTEYYNILSMESRVAKYFYYAPFSGTITEVYSEPGSIANPGAQIAKIARTGEFELKVPVSLEVLDHYKNQKKAKFTNSEGNIIATGSVIRVSDVINQRTQSADVYYSVKPSGEQQIYNGLYLNVILDVETETNSTLLPRTAVNEGKVAILNNGKVEFREVVQLGEKTDSLYVSGISDGQTVILEQIGKISDEITYKPIER